MTEGDDESYLAVDGSNYTVFDYLGDAADNMGNCYNRIEGTVMALGEGVMRMTSASLPSQKTIVHLIDGGFVEPYSVGQRTEKILTDLVPECLPEWLDV